MADSGASDHFVLNIEEVSKSYGKIEALKDISLGLEQGTHTLVLGPNGAGKTTLLKSIMGLISFDGTITVGGLNLKKETRKAKRLLGYVPQNYAFYENLSVFEHARLSSRLKETSDDEVEQKLESVNLWHVKSRKVRALSDGMKQRLGIALALIGNPPLLLLDEPTSNVDLKGQLEFQALLQALLKEGKTIMTTTHLSGMGEIADQVVILDRGKLVARGKPETLLAKVKATDTLYLRVIMPSIESVKAFLADAGVDGVSSNGEWITVTLPVEAKMGLIRKLLTSGNSVQDIIVERTTIESEYFKLLERGND